MPTFPSPSHRARASASSAKGASVQALGSLALVVAGAAWAAQETRFGAPAHCSAAAKVPHTGLPGTDKVRAGGPELPQEREISFVLRFIVVLTSLLLYFLSTSSQERTFIAIKPDGVQRGLIAAIIARFENKGFKLVGMKMLWPTKEKAESHYSDLSSKPFFAVRAEG